MAKLNGERLRRQRVTKRISQAQLADAAGDVQQTVSDVETGANTSREKFDLFMETLRRMPANPRVKRTRRAA